MQLTRKSLEKFKTLYKHHFGEELSDEEAKRKAEWLVELYRVVYDVPCAVGNLQEE